MLNCLRDFSCKVSNSVFSLPRLQSLAKTMELAHLHNVHLGFFYLAVNKLITVDERAQSNKEDLLTTIWEVGTII